MAEPEAGTPASWPTDEPLQFRALNREQVDDREIERLLEVILDSFGEWPPFDPGVPAIDHLRWKMSSPAGDVAALVGEIGDVIACCQICVTQRIQIGRETMQRVRSTDFSVPPAFRGRGFAAAMSKRKSDLVGQPTLRLTESRHPAVVHISRKAGGRPLGNPVRSLLLPLDPRRMARQGGGGWRAAATGARAVGLLLLSRLVRRRRDPGTADASGVVVRRIERFDERFAALWEAARSAFDVLVERTPEYLDWRYCDPRGGRFMVEAAESPAVGEAPSILGYAVWRVESGAAVLVDLLALPGRLDVVGRLVDVVVGGAIDSGAVSVLCWLPSRHPYRKALVERGFVGRPAGVTHLVRPDLLSPEAAAILTGESTRIHFTLGDSDFL